MGSCCGSDVSSSCVSDDDDDEGGMMRRSDVSDCGGGEFEDGLSRYRVVMLGAGSVGKSALVEQFMTSEYINTYDASLGGLLLLLLLIAAD
jgi:hypothetical protein